MDIRKPFDFDELGEAQLVALTPEQVARVIDWECAAAGIPLIGDAPVPPATAAVDEDMTGYVVKDLSFARRADAEAVAELASTFPRLDSAYVSGPSYKQKWFPQTDPIQVLDVRHYSETKAANCAIQIQETQENKKAYDAARTAYDNASRQRQKIVDAIQGKIRAARTVENDRTLARQRFAKYLALAEGSRRLACRFIMNAYPDAPDLIPEMFAPDEQGPIEVVQRKYVPEDAGAEVI